MKDKCWEDVEKLQPSCVAGGGVQPGSCCGDQSAGSQKAEHRITVGPGDLIHRQA